MKLIALLTAFLVAFVISSDVEKDMIAEDDDDIDMEDNSHEQQDLSHDENAVSILPLKSMDVPVDGGSCLAVHNQLRALHKHTPALKWDSDLARQAQKWADHLGSILKMVHSPRSTRRGQGENLAYGQKYPDTRPPRTCENAIKAWYAEIKNYDWENPGKKKDPNGQVIGHFTQLVWKSSQKLGMGIKVVKSGGWVYTYIVARYSPGGNVGGQYAANVMPLKTQSTPCDSNPCKNQGKCIDKFTSYSCKCTAMYHGTNCENKRDCKNTFDGCEQHKSKICHEKWYKHYIKRCLVTCGICTPATTKPPAPSSGCQDKASYCAAYKKEICLDRRYAYYLPNCKKTCGKCSATPCKDKLSYCQRFKRLICHNQRYAHYIPSCKKTCKKC